MYYYILGEVMTGSANSDFTQRIIKDGGKWLKHQQQ